MDEFIFTEGKRKPRGKFPLQKSHSIFSLQAKMEVEDLFVDLADGIKLLKLLEIISGEKLGKPNSGRMRVHKIENVNKSLAFLHTKVSSFSMHELKVKQISNLRLLQQGQ